MIASLTSEVTNTSSTENLIEDVTIYHENDTLVATAVTTNPDNGLFAFYVLRNEERIHTQQYSPDPSLIFNTKKWGSGIYRVLSFLMNRSGTSSKKYSKPIFLYPSPCTLSSPNKLYADDRALQLNGVFWKFPALYFSSEYSKLFVMTSAAVDRNKITLPNFNRWTWAGAGKFPGHVLCIADPTLELNKDMKLGWYLGTDRHEVTDDLCRFIRRFALILGIPDDKIVFWGSSGGGFAALALASRIEGSVAVAINAQTDALSYQFFKDVDMVRNLCFSGRTAAEIRAMFLDRVNMAEAWASNRNSRVILVQNKLDTHHHNCHYQPFWAALGGKPTGGRSTDGRHYAWIYEDARGHVPESELMIPEILRWIDSGTCPTST